MDPNGGGSGGVDGNRIRVVKFMECRRNIVALPGGRSSDGCIVFEKSGPVGTPECMFCATCGCHRKFHRKQEIPNYPTDNLSLQRLASAAAYVSHPPSPLPPRPPRPPVVALLSLPPPPSLLLLPPPPAASNPPPGWETCFLEEDFSDESQPLKKRRIDMAAGGVWSSTLSTGGV